MSKSNTANDWMVFDGENEAPNPEEEALPKYAIKITDLDPALKRGITLPGGKDVHSEADFYTPACSSANVLAEGSTPAPYLENVGGAAQSFVEAQEDNNIPSSTNKTQGSSSENDEQARGGESTQDVYNDQGLQTKKATIMLEMGSIGSEIPDIKDIQANSVSPSPAQQPISKESPEELPTSTGNSTTKNSKPRIPSLGEFPSSTGENYGAMPSSSGESYPTMISGVAEQKALEPTLVKESIGTINEGEEIVEEQIPVSELVKQLSQNTGNSNSTLGDKTKTTSSGPIVQDLRVL